MKSIISLLIGALLLFSNCTTKSVDLEVFEKDCKNFKIDGVSYENISDPSCTDGLLTGQLKVTFTIEGEDKCVNRIVTYPRFYNNANKVINPPSFKNTFYLGEPDLVINGKIVTFTFNYAFDNTTDAAALEYINMRFETQNDIGNASNSQEIRINMTCSTPPDPSTYNQPKETVSVPSKNISIRFWDNAAEDGDIISVFLNDKWILENYMITNAGEVFNYTVNTGTNKLIIYAVNQGKSGPNTLSVAVNSGKEIKLEPNLLTGESVNIKF